MNIKNNGIITILKKLKFHKKKHIKKHLKKYNKDIR